MGDKMIRLLRASAGSGKTHCLTQAYIDRLLDGDDDSYKHILAVTFTNKATDEMKDRIIEELYNISTKTDDPRSGKARRRLKNLLHDYSCFSISTIDSFFQTVMRSFAREIGQYASFKVELDTADVLERSIDLMLDSLSDPSNARLLKWLKEFTISRIRSGARWDPKEPLRKFSSLFLMEDFKLKKRSGGKAIESMADIEACENALRIRIGSFEDRLKAYGKAVISLMDRYGYTVDSFAYRSTGPMTLFGKWAQGRLAAPQSDERFNKALDGKPEDLASMAYEAVGFYKKECTAYESAVCLMDNLHLLGIYSDVYETFNAYLRDNNLVLLSESTDILGQIIDGNDTPFIYEKTGLRYDHILLDESQDTSVLQWQNFKPLFKECLAKGKSCLIVGDIKQSIYRWRGSDWKLISEYVTEDLGADNVDDSDPLEFNWRSGRAVIGFNNDVFTRVGEVISADIPEIGDRICEVYSDAHQEIPEDRKNVPEGGVSLSFLPADGWKKAALEKTVEDVNRLHSAGYEYSDICILVRTNVEGTEVSNCLISNGLGVMTEDSLSLDSSDFLHRIIFWLGTVSSSEGSLNALLSEKYGEAPSTDGKTSLYEICEEMIRCSGIQAEPSDIPFINTFMDQVLSYQDKYGSSVRGFVNWWNETGCRKSICAPEGRDAVRIMTIHKSKGLSLEAVIIPFLQETFLRRGSLTETAWFTVPDSVSEVGLVPMSVTKKLTSTVFADQYSALRLYQYIDNINTAYVAMTRARNQMIIYAPEPENTKKYSLESFSDILYKLYSDKLVNGTVTFGTLEAPERESSKAVNDIPVRDYRIVPAGSRLTLTFHGADNLDEVQNPRVRGIELHDKLSGITVKEDLAKVCGKDTESYDYLLDILNRCPYPEWYDGSFEVFNEATVVSSDGNFHRPDRIMIDRSASKAVVVDYKFGRQSAQYSHQVTGYCDRLREAGFRDVSGYIWYVGQELVVKV